MKELALSRLRLALRRLRSHPCLVLVFFFVLGLLGALRLPTAAPYLFLALCALATWAWRTRRRIAAALLMALAAGILRMDRAAKGGTPI